MEYGHQRHVDNKTKIPKVI